jgi:hypothetical protein
MTKENAKVSEKGAIYPVEYDQNLPCKRPELFVENSLIYWQELIETSDSLSFVSKM